MRNGTTVSKQQGWFYYKLTYLTLDKTKKAPALASAFMFNVLSKQAFNKIT
jgi:hypothetical protein